MHSNLPLRAAARIAPLVALALFAVACSDPAAAPSVSPRGHGADLDASSSASSDASRAGDGAAAGGEDGAVPPSSGSDGGAGSDAASTPQGALVAYASGYGPNLAVFTVDATTGALNAKGTTAAISSSPSFLAVNRDSTNLYAVSEETAGRVAAYSIDKSSGALTYLNDVSSKGNGPAHVSVDGSGRWVLAANYGDGTVAVLPVQSGGKLGDATDTQTVGANAHMILVDPSNQYVFVPCKGADYIAQFRFDASAGKLTANATPHVATAPGAGPRHLAFHPSGKLAYLINENNSTMTAYAFDGATGRLSELQTVSTLPAGFTGANTGAEIWVHPSGKFVYGSNRGHDSIAVFAVDGQTGKLTLKGHTKTGGTTPRDFTLDPSGTLLYAANQGTGNVVPFQIDPAQGTLAPASTPVNVTAATFIGVVHLPAP